MEEDKLYQILCEVLGDKMNQTEVESFISFLRACGAYHEYVKSIDLEYLKTSFKHSCFGNFSYFLYNIIGVSFVWHQTNKGFSYWYIIQKVHRLVLNIRYNLIENGDELHRRFSKSLITSGYFQEVKNQSLFYCENEKQLIYFINELDGYLKKNKLI